MVPIEEGLCVETLAAMIMNFDSDDTNEYDEIVSTLISRGSYTYALKKLDLDLETKVTPLVRLSIEKSSVLELKVIPSHLCYSVLESNNTLPIIIVVYFLESQVKALISVL